MKYLLLPIIFFCSSFLYGQVLNNPFHVGQDYSKIQCLEKDIHSKIKEKLFAKRDSFANLGVIPYANSRNSDHENQILLDWPVSQNSNFDDVAYYAISNFVDHADAYPNVLQDFNCGERSYDLPNGYNHAGTDIFSSPFPWMKMDNDQVEIVAAAAGYVIYKEESKNDKNCDFNNDGQWNAVYVGHDDGSIAWYGHLKKNSLTNLPIGGRIEAGEYIGVMGSSGFSTGPHLHFELYDSNDQLIDPFIGDCNPTSNRSWWRTQKPYKEPGLLKVMTHGSPPVPYGCYEDEKYNNKTNFSNGQTVYLASYYRDQTANDFSYHRLVAPNGTIFEQWEKQFEQDYASSYWYWQLNVTSALERGQWKYEVVYENQQTQTHFFYIANTSDKAELLTNEKVFINDNTEDFVISLTNNGNIGLDIQKIELSGALSGKWYGTISPNEEKQLMIKVDTAIFSNQETITITSNENEPFIIRVFNQDQGFASIAIDNTNLDFGEITVNLIDSLALNIANEGSNDLLIPDWEFPTGFDGPTGPLEINPFSDTLIYIYFKPKEARIYNEEIIINSNAENQATLSFAVNGIGLEAPVLADRKETISSFNIYPNPIDNYLVINYNNYTNFPTELKVIDTNGKTIFVEKYTDSSFESPLKLNIRKLQPGAYLLLVKDNYSNLTSFKFIKK